MKNNYSPFLILLFVLTFSFSGFSQGGVCADIEPFCAGDQALIFPNCNNVDPNCNNSAELGPDYGCLITQPYPAWFFLQIDQAGDLDFQIIQNTSFDVNGNPTGTGLDVDFICWGPFNQGDDLCDYSQLQSFNEIDCSFSIAPVENFTIPGAVPGQIYVLVITNYNQSPGFISLQQTNAGTPGSGSTDCSILTTQIGCEGDVFTLDATTLGASNYLWEYDDGTGYVVIFNGNFPSINVTQPGDYRVTISFNLGTDQIREFEVIIYPQPVIASPPNNLFQCADTGTGIFDLTVNTPLVLGGQNPADYNITYHTSQADADSGAAPIGTPGAYLIATPPVETVYVRIEDLSGTCFATDSFTITFATVTSGPVTPNPFIICDQDNNGMEVINLSAVFNPMVLAGQNPLDFTVSYHTSQADADNDVAPLPTSYIVTTANAGSTIYIRVENNDETTCFDTSQNFVINMDTPPVVNPMPDPLVVCDDDNNGLAMFTLHDADMD
ncbi:MAG: hypothetical protein CL605_11410, partial [Altibacter sp.]|nr:hypothetical protein [Altibacter sp.]